MTERTKLTLVALASAAMPDSYFTGARTCYQTSAQDEAEAVDCAVIQNASGRLYDVWVTNTPAGKERLSQRVKAAHTLEDIREIGAMSFTVEQVMVYQPGTDPQSPTGDVAVAIMTHAPGHTRDLKLLDMNDCSAVGTAIAAIHRVNSHALTDRFYPSYTTQQIKRQLIAWINTLRRAGHVPKEIVDSWGRIVQTEGLWSFRTRMVHGGFHDEDFLFTKSGLSAVHNWQNMQVNDPARDLAWIFSELDQSKRDAVLAAYGRMMGSRMDDLIMLRAKLWLQMEQVGDFILALEQADNDKIIRFKAQVERLAQELSQKAPKAYTPGVSAPRRNPEPASKKKPARPADQSDQTAIRPKDQPQSEGLHRPAERVDNPSTITVGSLLQDSHPRSSPSLSWESRPTPVIPTPEPVFLATGEMHTQEPSDEAAQEEGPTQAIPYAEDSTIIRPAYHASSESLTSMTGKHAAVKRQADETAGAASGALDQSQAAASDSAAPDRAGKHSRRPAQDAATQAQHDTVEPQSSSSSSGSLPPVKFNSSTTLSMHPEDGTHLAREEANFWEDDDEDSGSFDLAEDYGRDRSEDSEDSEDISSAGIESKLAGGTDGKSSESQPILSPDSWVNTQSEDSEPKTVIFSSDYINPESMPTQLVSLDHIHHETQETIDNISSEPEDKASSNAQGGIEPSSE